jgi:FkbM family methyltransferase
MVPAECVIWAYRLFLNRDPSDDEVSQLCNARDPAQIRSVMTSSGQFSSMLDRAGRRFCPRLPVDFSEGVIWAFRLLLKREPDEDEVDAYMVLVDSVSDLRLRFVLSREFELNAGEALPLIYFAIVTAFAPFKTPDPVPENTRDFLGTTTSVRYFPADHAHLGGMVWRPGAPGLHGTAEWMGTLRSILECGKKFTAFELGAGWGPWLVASLRGAELKGIDDVRLVGVEASADHFSFMRQHFEANGLDPDAFSLHRAIIAPADGVAQFPKLHVGAEDYGASAVFNPNERDSAALRGELEEVRAIGLTSLLSDHERVDLIHMDIQGHEEDVIRSAMSSLNDRVRRMIIGTHSRSIEGHLLELLSGQGWICEYEQPCKLQSTADGHLIMVTDGEQVWRNPRQPAQLH